MTDKILIYFSLPSLVFVLLIVLLLGGLLGWLGGRLSYRASWGRMSELVNVLPYGVVVAQADGRVLLFNREAWQLWGGGGLPTHLEGPLAMLVSQTQHSAECSVHSLNAPSGLWLQVRATALRSGLILLVIRDLSSQQRQDAFYRNFISNVSHELKTPLTVIQGHVAALGEGLAADDPGQTSRRIVAQETARLTQLVDNLLLLSRLEMPDFSLDRRSINIEALVEDAILQLSDLAEARDVSISLQKEGNLPRIMADRARLKQVFINLLDNAIKYNRQGGVVTVRLSAANGRLTAQISDAGEGIPRPDLPHIFEKMYRVERPQGHYVEGSGLGLSIVRRLVAQHGGIISVESQIGEGTTFTVTLPQ